MGISAELRTDRACEDIHELGETLRLNDRTEASLISLSQDPDGATA